MIAGFACPLCGSEIIKDTWKGQTIWHCKSNPHCSFAIFSDIEEVPCPLCHKPFLLKKFDHNGSVELHCSTNGCGYMRERPRK